MTWTLVYYPDHGSVPDPGTGEKRRKLMGFLILCDVECSDCGFAQHPPQGGRCPSCGEGGDVDYDSKPRVERELDDDTDRG